MRNLESISLLFCVSIFFTSTAQDTRALEKRISDLEKRVLHLEKKALSSDASSDQNVNVSKIQDYQITAKLFTKKFQPADYSNPRDNLTFLITFNNFNQANIGQIKGNLIFINNLTDTLLLFYADIIKLLPANGNNSWYGGIPYDATNPSHKEFLDADINTISIKLKIDEITFSDGTKKVFK
jgi:hypothetical protein